MPLAANYPALAGYRRALDVEGCRVFQYGSSHYSQSALNLSASQESRTPSIGGGEGAIICFFFSQPMDVDGWVASHTHGGSSTYYSTDAVNPEAATWNYLGASAAPNLMWHVMRANVVSSTLLGVRAFRVNVGGGGAYGDSVSLRGFHVWGEPTDPATNNPHRLEIWHPTLDQKIAPTDLDHGDVDVGTSSTVTFRVKNRSASQTANAIIVTSSLDEDTSPSLGTVTQVDTGSGFVAQSNIGNLAPGAVTSVFSQRTSPIAGTPYGPFGLRITATPGSWT